MTTPPNPIDALARTILDAVATGVDQEPITDDEWNDPDIEATRTAICEAIRATLAGPLTEIAAERTRQDEKWGEQNHPNGTGEGGADVAKLAKRLCQQAAARGEVTWALILDEEVCEAYAESDPARLRAELVQVAAVATAWVEAIDRRAVAPNEPSQTVQHVAAQLPDELGTALLESVGRKTATEPSATDVLAPAADG